MSRFTFNRKRLLLKKLLGIRARVALLALILVAPLVLERAYSLEDARAKEIADQMTKPHESVTCAADLLEAAATQER